MAGVTNLDERRARTMDVCVVTLPPPAPKPEGPFTVTVSDPTGKLFEVVFPDYTGEISADQAVLGSTFDRHVLANLLAGSMRVFLGAV
jgi:hypothetical protein